MRMTALAAGEEVDVRRVFRGTLALGRPLPIDDGECRRVLHAYEELCLGWYLRDGHAAVLRDSADRVIGYTLVCVDPRAHERWERGQALRFVRTIAAPMVTRRLPPIVDRFVRLRVRDGWRIHRSRPAVDGLPHAHVNAEGGQGSWPGKILLDHVDDVCRAAGFSSWWAEVNASKGRRAAALERLGARIVARTDNATMSWLTDRPVERLTIVRTIPTGRPLPSPAAAA